MIRFSKETYYKLVSKKSFLTYKKSKPKIFRRIYIFNKIWTPFLKHVKYSKLYDIEGERFYTS